MVKDLVCGMQVDEEQAEAQGLISEHEGEEYFFCSPGCKQSFDQNPEAYLEAQ
jgi:Cu+-exporting ATPase